jgi:RNA polymerase sigma-70 factor (ECF subfamily)
MELHRLTSSFHGADTPGSPETPRLRVVTPETAADLQPSVALPEDVVSDDALNAAMIAGDTSALGALYDRHAPIVFALLLRILRDRTAAEDLLQEVFLRAWQQADLFDETRGTMRCWLYSMAHNLALNELRRRRRRPQRYEPSASDADDGDHAFAALVDPDADPADDACCALRNAQIAAVLAQLPPRQQEVLRLYAAGFSQSEIAARLGEPLGTIKSRMRRSLAHLRVVLPSVGVDGGEFDG